MMIAEAIDEYALVAEMSEGEAIEPRSLAEARCRPDWELWEKGIHQELALLREARTWELTIPPENANIVGSKWVFRAKKDTAGIVVCYKARLIAQGFSQVPSVDYFDTFAPIAKLASIQTVQWLKKLSQCLINFNCMLDIIMDKLFNILKIFTH